MRSRIQQLADKHLDDYFAEHFPDPKHRAFARWYSDVLSKCRTHVVLWGREPTEEEIRSFMKGAAAP